jgi:hypothetical protein
MGVHRFVRKICVGVLCNTRSDALEVAWIHVLASSALLAPLADISHFELELGLSCTFLDCIDVMEWILVS